MDDQTMTTDPVQFYMSMYDLTETEAKAWHGHVEHVLDAGRMASETIRLDAKTGWRPSMRALILHHDAMESSRA